MRTVAPKQQKTQVPSGQRLENAGMRNLTNSEQNIMMFPDMSRTKCQTDEMRPSLMAVCPGGEDHRYKEPRSTHSLHGVGGHTVPGNRASPLGTTPP